MTPLFSQPHMMVKMGEMKVGENFLMRLWWGQMRDKLNKGI